MGRSAIRRTIMVSAISVMPVVFTAKMVRGTIEKTPFIFAQIPRIRRMGISAIRSATIVSDISVMPVVFTTAVAVPANMQTTNTANRAMRALLDFKSFTNSNNITYPLNALPETILSNNSIRNLCGMMYYCWLWSRLAPS